MQIRIFTIPLYDSEECSAELNRFLASHRVLEVEQHLVATDIRSYWTFCVKYLQCPIPAVSGSTQRDKVDYKQVLSEAHFAIFSRLREIRKELAAKDAVPAYAVFTDEELSHIAQLEQITPESARKIKGVGEKKMEKYGTKLIAQLHETTGISD